MKYTFLLPAYKKKFLYAAIHSILSQTYKDFCVIISDDCSPEDLYSVVSMFEDERVKYRRNSTNIGAECLVDHWNALVKECDSEYLIMASDDDVFSADFLQEIDTIVCEHPCLNVIRGRANIIDANNKVLFTDPVFPQIMDELSFVESLYRSTRCIANYVFKTSVMKQNGGFVNFPYAWYSDLATVIYMSHNGAGNTKSVCFSYRYSMLTVSSQHNSLSMQGKLDATMNFNSWMELYLNHVKYEHTESYDKLFRELVRHYLIDIYSHVVSYSKYISLKRYVNIIITLSRGKYFSLIIFLKYQIAYCINRFKKF